VKAIVSDLKRGPVYFRLKKLALKAKAEAKEANLKTRLTKTDLGWKLAKARK